jgi:alkanesulfonate monooxygenase SsuD/methylene tetrahydromethanopterin reductase-like flavin-dependent oxidoreductase (luciferase family)
MGALYREAPGQADADEHALAISVAIHGFIGRDGRAAKQLFFRHEQAAYHAFSRFPARSWEDGLRTTPPAAWSSRDPEEIAQRIIDLHHHVGHSRHFLQMDIGGMPHAELLKSIELLGPRWHPGCAQRSDDRRRSRIRL